jgi:hypothetical protein
MELFWKKAGWEKEDRHISQLNEAPFKRRFPKAKLSPGVTLIRGPRQIGKSTWIKLLLSEKLKQTTACFFHSCEDIRDFVDLAELIRSQPNSKFFFFDEITFVSEWWRTIKKHVDSDRSTHFILTGSNSYDLRHGLDLMPGRWSTTGELNLLPMLFDEWLEMRKEAGWKTLDRVDAIRLYMKVGGFPPALIESGSAGRIPRQAIATYSRWIMGDVVKLGRQELFMKELLNKLVAIMGTPISLQGLAQKTQLMSYHTVQDYLSILEHAFALRVLLAYDPDTDTFRFKKDKKYYFTDPIVYWASLELSGGKITDAFEQQLAEMIASEYLARSHKRLGYYSTKDGEVDFISQRDLAVEVKWSPVVKNLSPAYKKLRLANKRVWSQENLLLG